MFKGFLYSGAALLALNAGTRAAYGNALYLAEPINYTGGSSESVFIYGTPGITGTVSGGTLNVPFTIGANKVAQISLGSTNVISNVNTVENKGVVVRTDNAASNVGASYLSRLAFTTDSTYLFDQASLGTSYYAVGYPAVAGVGAQLTVAATVDGTVITVTPKTALTGHAAGVPFNTTLNAGQTVMFAGNDVTGTSVTSTQPIAVFGGSSCAVVPVGSTACDHTLTALPSTDRFTTSAIAPKTTNEGPAGSAGNRLRVLAGSANTQVFYNGVLVATLALAGDFYEFDGKDGGLITADKPVLVNEFLTGQSTHPELGDPAQSWVPGTDQYLNDYIFSTAIGTEAYPVNSLAVAIQTANVGSLSLNGSSVSSSLCAALGTTSYSTCNIPIDVGAGEISASVPFLGLVSGFGSYDTSFTFLGATFSPGASPPPPPPPPTSPPVVTVPEPSTLAIMGISMLGFAALRRRVRS